MINEKVRTITTVLGVSLGIAVVIAIQLTNASSVRGFETALETVAGKTAIEIIGTGAGVTETLLPELSWLREFGIISPVIEGSAALVVGDVKQLSRRQMEAVKILGIDILRDQPFRDYQLLEIQKANGPTGQPASAEATAGRQANGSRDFNTQQFLQILTSEQTVVITEKLSTRRNYPLGSTLRLMIGDRVLPFVVRGVLKNEGPARVLDGNFIMMDIAAAQLAFDRLGRVDRVDVLLHHPTTQSPRRGGPGLRLAATRPEHERRAMIARPGFVGGNVMEEHAAQRNAPLLQELTHEPLVVFVRNVEVHFLERDQHADQARDVFDRFVILTRK